MQRKNDKEKTILFTFELSILIGFIIGFILTLNISIKQLVPYYIFGFGISSITWVLLTIHYKKIQKLHNLFTFIFIGTGIGLVFSGIIVITFIR